LENAIRGNGLVNSTHFTWYLPTAKAMAAEHTKQHLFTDHFVPIMYLLVPIYWLLPSPVTMFVLQALLIASSIWPIYQIAKKVLGNESWSLAVVLLYCLYPSVIATSWHFMPGVFALSFLVWAFWALHEKRYGTMLVFLLLTLATKEIAALPVFSFGAYILFKERMKMLGTGVMLFSIAWLMICYFWVIPSYSPEGNYPHQGMYQALGSSLTDVAKNVLTNPRILAPYLFSGQTLRYVGGLLAPLIFLPILRLDIFLLSVPVMLQNILIGTPGEDTRYRWIAGHWSAMIAPFTFVALIYAVQFLHRKWGIVVVRNLLLCTLFYSALIMPGAILPEKSYWSNPELKWIVSEIEKRVPHGSSISTDIGQMLTKDYGTYYVSLYPAAVKRADYVAVRWRHSLDPEYIVIESDPDLKEIWRLPDEPGKVVLYKRVKHEAINGTEKNAIQSGQ